MSRKASCWGWYLGLGMITASAYAGWANCAVAQITPDGTLPNNSTIDININGNIFNISGGTRAGSNLFHSFRDFSVLNGSEAHFNNPVDINNIISRVTGSSVSDINGLIRVVQGNANFFLLNPNGIVFGPNARLDVRGSFVASTANSIKFADGFEFSAKNTQATPLLTVSVPLGLQFGASPQSIQVQGSGHNFTYSNDATVRTDSPGLQVQSGKTLALVGGDIQLEGGNLRAESGRVELGSVASPSLVNLTQTDSGFALGYAGVQNFGDIKLSQKASVDASGAGGGSIQVQGRRLSLRDGSSILSITSGSNPGGSFTVNATESVELIGQSIDNKYASSLSSEVQGAGSSGEMRINTGKLIATNGAFAQNFNFSSGEAGNLTVQASDIDLVGRGLYPSGLYTGTGSTGNSGNLTITSGKLSVRDGATVFANTYGKGNGGNLTVNASEKVEVIGTSTDGYRSKLSTDTASESKEATAGNLTINTPVLLVQDGGSVSASTYGAGKGGNLTVNASKEVQVIDTRTDGQIGSRLGTDTSGTGNAGELTINTRRLVVKDSQVSSSTFGKGDAGNLTVNASDSVELSGEIPGDEKGFPGGLFAQVDTTGEGRGGNLMIETGRLSVSDGSKVQVATFGNGDAGNLFIRASEIEVFDTPIYNYYSTGIIADVTTDPRTVNPPKGNGGNLTIETGRLSISGGRVSSTTTSGNGGNIFLTIKHLLLLRNQSIISATAGNAQQGGNGGNITIDAPNGFIVAVPFENSDITANAYSGQGGNISIRAANLFNIAPLSRQDLEQLRPNDLNPRQLQTNDITAISQQNPNLSGRVNINTPNVDPSRTLTELPAVLVDTSMIVDSTCGAFAGKPGNQFTITGRGGLPPTPNEPLTTDVVWSDTRLPATTAVQHQEETPTAKQPSQPEAVAIVLATGWVFNGKGQVTLISSASHATSLKSSAASCPQR